jgi:hypothetical protein
LVNLELDESGRQRSGSEIARLMFFNNGKIVDFGETNMHTQVFTLNFKPRFPFGKAATKFFDNSGSFVTTYNWINPLQPDVTIRDIAKTATWTNTIRYSLNLRLKSLGNQIFGIQDPRLAFQKPVIDTTPKNLFATIGHILKSIFFDWESVKFDFNQTNSSINPGVFGTSGFGNFWAGMIGNGLSYSDGPGFPYQLGLTSDPHGSIGLKPSSSFPWFGFRTYPGKRPPDAVLQDQFTQRTTFDIRTSRPLWPGAVLDLNWRTVAGFSRNSTVLTDIDGNPTYTNIMQLESIDRTILTLPSVFGLNLFNNTIEDVIAKYEMQKEEILASNMDTVTKNQALNNALASSFRDGMEAFNIFSGDFSYFLPSINWALRWEGIEKWPFLRNIGARRISLEHKYQSRYTEQAQVTDNGKAIQAQIVQHGFQPLIGITIAFDEKKLKGTLTGNIRYSTTNQYQLTSSNRSTITRTSTDELQIQVSYVMRGFEFKLLGISLQNDLEFSFMTSVKKNNRATYDVSNYAGEDGRQLDGSTMIKVEPRVRYSLSNRVTASAFVSYEATLTSGAASPGFSTTQIGIDLRLSLAGGR